MRKKYVLTAVCLFMAAVSSFADENKNPSLRVILPHIGTFNLGEVVVSVMPSPMVRMPDWPNEASVIPSKRQAEWEAGVNRQWLRLELKNPVVVEFRTHSLSSYHALHSRSLYISPAYDDDIVWGKLFGFGLIDVSFRIFTINVEVDESEKIEVKRNALIELGKNKKGIKLRGRLVRIETSAMNLFSPGTQKVDFLDFYIKDVEFVKY